jgi:hypothetical protein
MWVLSKTMAQTCQIFVNKVRYFTLSAYITKKAAPFKRERLFWSNNYLLVYFKTNLFNQVLYEYAVKL